MIAESPNFDVKDITTTLSAYKEFNTDVDGLVVRVNLVRDGLVELETWFKKILVVQLFVS